MKELSKEKQLEVSGGSIYLISTACIVASIAIFRMLQIGRMNIARLVGQRKY